MSNKQKSNKEKFEKNISKKLKKLYAAGKLNPNTESRLLFVSGKYGFSVIRMEEVPGSGRSFVDSAEMVMNRTVAKALSATNLYISGNIGSIKARMYDGLSLANSYDAKRDVIPPSVDYAKMQGIDLDEAADRQRDNYVDHPDGRKATVTQTNASPIGSDIKRLYDKVVEERMKLKQELNEAHDKATKDNEKIKELEKKLAEMTKTINDQYAKNAALQKDVMTYTDQMAAYASIRKGQVEERNRLQELHDDTKSEDADAAADRKKIEELEKKLADAGKTITACYVKNTQLQKDKDGILAQLNSIKEERDRLQKFYDDTKSEDADAAEEIATIVNCVRDEVPVETLAENSNTEKAQETTPDTEEGTDEYKYVVNTPFTPPVHNDELPDNYMVTLLQNTKKPYNLRTIFNLQSYIYGTVEPDVYEALIGIHDPRTTNVRKFSRTAYAAAIALSVPESYVGSFMKRLIDDYKCGNFIPTDPKYIPEDFPNFVKSLYPDIDRIHRLLHTKTQLLPYVYKKENDALIDYYTIGTRPYDNPSDIRDADYYIAIPKFANPYDFLEYSKTKELVMIFDCSGHNRRIPIQHIMTNVDASEFRNECDKKSTMRDQINRYLTANDAGLISIDCNNPTEILKNDLWFYPVVWGWSERKYLVKYATADEQTEISSEPKQDSNEK